MPICRSRNPCSPGRFTSGSTQQMTLTNSGRKSEARRLRCIPLRILSTACASSRFAITTDTFCSLGRRSGNRKSAANVFGFLSSHIRSLVLAHPKEQEHIMIRKLKSGEYRLYSRKINPKTGKRRNLGTFSTREKAMKHEKAVQFFKRRAA